MEEKQGEPATEEPIRVNLIKDSKQTRITIPAYIVENFHIDPDRYEFGWFIQELGKDKEGKDVVSIFGKFIHKDNERRKAN